jgi:hypothetical protein
MFGVDSMDGHGFRGFHKGDVCNPVVPESLAPRLFAAGFVEVDVERGDDVFRFAARTG